MKKILFYSIYSTYKPILGIEMELISQHLQKGNKVYILRCNGELSFCEPNPNHRTDFCKKCKMTFNQNMELINVPKESIINIPKIDISYEMIPKSFANVDELMNFSLEGIKFGLCTASTMVSDLRDHKFDTIKEKGKINRVLKTSYFTYKFMQDVLNRIKPDAIYHQGGRVAIIYPITQLADKMGIKRYSICSANTADKYDVMEGFYFHELNKIKMDIEKKWLERKEDFYEKAVQWYIDKRNGVNSFSFSKDQIKNSLPKDFDNNKYNVAIFNSSIDEYYANEDFQSSIYKDETEALRLILEHFKDNTDIHFYLRIHPNLKDLQNSQVKDLKEIEAKNYKNLTIIHPEDKIDSYTLVMNTQKTITYMSTVGVEACFWEKPSILIGRSFYEDLDCCYRPQDRNDLMDLISDKNLQPKDKIGAIKYSHWQISRGYQYQQYRNKGWTDGDFLGNSMDAKMNIIDKIHCKILKKIDKFKISFKNYCQKHGYR